MNKLKAVFAIFAIAGLFLPLTASAISLPYWGPFVNCAPGDGKNPVTDCSSLCGILQVGQNIAYFLITITVFAIAPILILYGGFVMLTSAGSDERIKHGRSVLTGTLVGIAISFGSFLIIATFLWALGTVVGGAGKVSWPNISCSAAASNSSNNSPLATSQSSNNNNISAATPNIFATFTNDQALNYINGKNIDVLSTGNCSDKNNLACTSLDGVRKSTLDAVIAFQNSCGCSVSITRGTEISPNAQNDAGACGYSNGCKVNIAVTGFTIDSIKKYPEIGMRPDGSKLFQSPNGTIFADISGAIKI